MCCILLLGRLAFLIKGAVWSVLEKGAVPARQAKTKAKKTLASFFCRKNKNTRRQVLQNKGPNRACSR
jgi:hypothetical protein